MCRITAVTDTALDCTLPPGPSGKAMVRVNVAGQGYATGSPMVEREFAIDDVQPRIGSVAGALHFHLSCRNADDVASPLDQEQAPCLVMTL